jgi:hypothetical protein
MFMLAKFVGYCNDAKRELDQCFRLEKAEKRKENLRKAREFDARYEESKRARAATSQKQSGPTDTSSS